MSGAWAAWARRALWLPLACLATGAWAELADTLARIKPSVVMVGTWQKTRSPAFRATGSGFAVGDGTLVATNAHVIPATLDAARLETLAIAVPDGEGRVGIRMAKERARDREHDLALIEFSGQRLPAVQLREAQDVREGENYAFTGFPLGALMGFHPTTHRGMISAIAPVVLPAGSARELGAEEIRRLESDRYPVYQLDAAALPGSSGSPLWDPVRGDVVGIVSLVIVTRGQGRAATQPTGISFALPIRHLRELLARAR